MKTFSQFVYEDGAAAGAGVAPTNVSSGLGSIEINGVKQTPPMSRRGQTKRQRENAKGEVELVKQLGKMRKIVGGVNV